MDFEVDRSDLHRTRVVDRPPPPLADGQALLRVEHFGFSANNITYAAFGAAMGYWNFFPAEDRWGRVPVWGFAEVAETSDTGLSSGERIYGYLPMGTELVVTVDRVSPSGFVEASAHRSALPSAYNGYTRVAADPVHEDGNEALEMLFRPLFMTDFVLDDHLADSDFFGAEVIVLSSASSKTSFGLAHLLAGRDGGPDVIGLTAAGNTAFVESLGVYDDVVAYDDLSAIDPTRPAVFVDMAGNAGVRSGVHHHFGELRQSIVVGGTHWDAGGDAGALPGPAPAFFFAPDQIVKRRRDWGPEGVEERFTAAWRAFMPIVSGWIDVEHRIGSAEVERTYREILSGDADPKTAFVLAM